MKTWKHQSVFSVWFIEHNSTYIKAIWVLLGNEYIWVELSSLDNEIKDFKLFLIMLRC